MSLHIVGGLLIKRFGKTGIRSVNLLRFRLAQEFLLCFILTKNTFIIWEKMQIPFIKILGYTIFNESYLLLTQQLKSETTSTFTED
ncbi:hypothetical protein EB796_011618 [Bugula neritina]|uniref:Uncharacterized protein n=1 Tax=Bugula neritina TaxID=10212 RepID=A0A7J7JVT2_BUGNE|nr:hypothetical protein EB796_011618 [Bugula neritina]